MISESLPNYYRDEVIDDANENNQAGNDRINNVAQKMRFPWRISSVDVTKSAWYCGFGHIYSRNS